MILYLFLSKERRKCKQKFPWRWFTRVTYWIDFLKHLVTVTSIFSLPWGIFISCTPSICFHSCVRVNYHWKISPSVSCVLVKRFIRLVYKQDNSMRAFCGRKSKPCSENVLKRVSKKHKVKYPQYTTRESILYRLLSSTGCS